MKKALKIILALVLTLVVFVKYNTSAAEVTSLEFNTTFSLEPTVGQEIPTGLMATGVTVADGNSSLDNGETYVDWRVFKDGTWDYATQGETFQEGQKYAIRFDIQNLSATNGNTFPATAPTIKVNGEVFSVTESDGIADSYWTVNGDTVSLVVYKVVTATSTTTNPTDPTTGDTGNTGDTGTTTNPTDPTTGDTGNTGDTGTTTNPTDPTNGNTVETNQPTTNQQTNTTVNSNVVKTSDNTNIVVWVLVLASSVVCLYLVLNTSKRNKKNY